MRVLLNEKHLFHFSKINFIRLIEMVLLFVCNIVQKLYAICGNLLGKQYNRPAKTMQRKKPFLRLPYIVKNRK